MSDIIADLKQKGIICSKQQREAILCGEKDTLLLAVPGSGKTTVLVSRIAQMLLYENYKPQEIIALTYNRAAAKDIGVRFESLFGGRITETPRFSTVHSLCYSILKQYAAAYGKAMPTLMDGSEHIPRPQSLLREIYQKHSDQFLTAEQIEDVLQTLGQAVNLLHPKELMQSREHGLTVKFLLEQYTARKKQLGVMDYDDMQVYALQILTQLPAFCKRVTHGKKWIFLDEAQDASLLQHKLIALLAKDRHVFFVGDEDQTIYDFRGASPKQLLQFEEEHPNGQVLRLETNYRCPSDLVAAADTVIRYNTDRYPKNMQAFRKQGESIEVKELANYKEQTDAVVTALKDLPEGKTAAVLAAHNVSLLAIAERLHACGIPYRRKDSDFRFSQNPAVRGFTQLLDYALHPKDTEAFLAAAKTLRFRKADAEKLCAYLQRFPNGFYAAMVAELTAKESKRFLNAANGFSLMQKQNGAQIWQTVMQSMGYEFYLSARSKSEEALPAGTALALYHLRSLAHKAKDAAHLMRLLEQTREFEQSDKGSPRAAITLSTVHGAKGLEFDHVCLVDTVEGCMPALLPPDASAQEKKENIEQQTRLFYVAATRAKERLTLYSAKEYWEKAVTPSRYLARLQVRRAGDLKRIVHRAFGEGEVLSVEGDTALVAFQRGVKSLQLDYCLEHGIITRA